MSGHGPDRATFEKASTTELTPEKIDGTMAFMFESRWPFSPTKWAMETDTLQPDYDGCWAGFDKAELP